jgi:hypothetical protein
VSLRAVKREREFYKVISIAENTDGGLRKKAEVQKKYLKSKAGETRV